jgi:hypothetical protein
MPLKRRYCSACPFESTTFCHPPEGIGEVIVNGVVALAKGQPTNSRSGLVLRHGCTGI